MNLQDKLNCLTSYLKQMDSVAVAFSGGVDSTFLLKVAHDALQTKTIAVTAQSPVLSERELREAVDFTRAMGIRHVVIAVKALEIKGFADNPVNRCYLCKYETFSRLLATATKTGIRHVVDGSNRDDLGDFRPGMKALSELGIKSPLQEAGMGKDDIRTLSKEMTLTTWDKPAFACLASRIPYGHKITKEKLRAIEQAEQFLLHTGFKQVRVRHFGDTARIEVSAHERSQFVDPVFMDRVHEKFKQLGFVYVTLDLKGYRTGSLNETINLPNKSCK